MTILEEANLRNDANEVLRDKNYGFKGLTRRDVPLGVHFGQALRCTLHMEACFCLALAAFLLPSLPMNLLAAAVLLGYLGFMAAPPLVLAASTLHGKLHKPATARAMVYWSFWPTWTFILCFLGALLGFMLGYFIWSSNIKAYREVSQLQVYQDIDPALVPGDQIADAGLVEFTKSVDVDRARGGCFVQAGTTYCVAPILHGGNVEDSLGNAPRLGSYDFFAVGLNCCNCPNQDFRCGDWENPLAQGGIRSTDFVSRPFYRLAVDQWAARWLKVSEHPLFFEWVQAPVREWESWWLNAAHTVLLAACGLPAAAFCTALLLGKLLSLLVAAEYASPLGTPGPPSGFERAWRRLLPELLEHHIEEKRQIGLPSPGYQTFLWAPPAGTGGAPAGPPLLLAATPEAALRAWAGGGGGGGRTRAAVQL